MSLLENQYRGQKNAALVPENIPAPSLNADAPNLLLGDCPAHGKTPLVSLKDVAAGFGVKHCYVKDETGRMGLGSFKALGAAYVIAHQASESGKKELSSALAGRTYVTASAGNHGLSVAVGAGIFGANSVIYLSKTVPDAFADRLRAKGAEVRVKGEDYVASMIAAQNAAEDEGFTLLSDSSWEGYFELPHRLMEGYLVCAKEIVDEMPQAPTHIFLQAGVGGLAGAMAAYFRKAWSAVSIIVVEPEAAPALQASIEAGKSVFADGPVSNMGRLDCKEPSLIALKSLAHDANLFMTISDELAADTVTRLAKLGISSTPSGVAGLAAVCETEAAAGLGLNDQSVCLCIISEGVE